MSISEDNDQKILFEIKEMMRERAREKERESRDRDRDRTRKGKIIKKASISPYSRSLDLTTFGGTSGQGSGGAGPLGLGGTGGPGQKGKKRTINLPSLDKEREKEKEIERRNEFTKEDVLAKTVSLPYAENYLRVEESVRFVSEWSPDKRETKMSLLSQSPVEAMKRRYPRFCEGMSFSDEINAYKIRSDLWLVRLIEECYDASSAECSKPVSTTRTRQRFNLDLGAMDSFPHSVRRYIAQKYSMLNILPQICMELLLALDRVMTVSDRVCIHRVVEENLVSNSGRAYLFSAFLAEELEVDRLAAYLETRDLLQDVAGFSLKDVIAHMQHPTGESAMSSRDVSDQDVVDLIDASKICPLKLPFHLRVMRDASMPEAPLLAIDTRSLLILCQRLAPKCSAESRKYLLNRIFFWTETLINRKGSLFRLLEYLREDFVASSETKYEGTIVEGLRVVPGHVILWALCSEFGNYKGPKQMSIAEALHAEGPKEAVNTEQGLAVLNRLYDNDRSLSHQLDAEIAAAELSHSQWKAKILDLEKQKRRIERKWKDYQPDFKLKGIQATIAEENKGYDLDELAKLKMTLLEAEESRSAAEALARRLKKKRTNLNNDIDSLWNSTLLGGSSQRKTGTVKQRLDWREMILNKMSEALNSNCSFYQHTLSSSAELSSKRPRTTEASTPVDGSKAEEGSFDQIVENSDLSALFEMSITEQIASLEAEARKLANISSELMGGISESKVIEPHAVSPVQTVTREGVEQTGFLADKKIPKLPDLEETYELDEETTNAIPTSANLDQNENQAPNTHVLDEEIVVPDFDIFSEENFVPKVLEVTSDIDEVQIHSAGAVLENIPTQEVVERCEPELIFDESLETEEKVRLYLERGLRIHLRKAWNHFLKFRKFTQCATWHVRRKLLLSLQKFQNFKKNSMSQRSKHNSLLGEYAKTHQLKRSRNAIRYWRRSVAWSKSLKAESLLKIQTLGRRFLAKRRVHRLKLQAAKREIAIQNSLLNLEAQQMKRAIFRFITWKNRRIHLRKAALALRKRRALPSFTLWRKLLSQVRLVYAARQFLARKQLRMLQEKGRRLGELFRALPSVIARKKVQAVFRHWLLLKTTTAIFRLTYRKALNTKLFQAVGKWKTVTAGIVAFRNRMATKIQSSYRMHLSIKHEMNFFVMRKGVVALQCIVRRKIAKEVVSLARKRHLSAITLQKIIRGYTYRIQLRRKRIQDIHEAAKSNNYERLLHYCECFYNLTFQLDENGNTALHNAAKFASKRCIKLLMKFYHDPSVVNSEGYTPLHLLILSAAPARDEVFEYMIEVGFDEDQLTLEGKNALLLASEHGRIRIANECLKHGQDPNFQDYYGSTPLQYACRNGYEPLVKSLLEFHADPNLPAQGGMCPLHDVTVSGNLDIAKKLLSVGANLNVAETVSGWTPLMMACRNGLEEMVDLFLSQAPDVMALDYSWCNAAHHSAIGNSIRIANSLREAEVDFYALDYEGNSPLHYAAQYGSVDVMREYLHSGAPASLQNVHGNQPAHIAAQYNQAECLKLLSRYDEHIGRMNYQHQTPLGVAKFYLARNAQKFLEEYFSKLEGHRNEEGDIWWDKELDQEVGDWKLVIDEANHRHFVNAQTGEISLLPPKVSTTTVQKIVASAQVPMRMRVLPQEEESVLNRKVYGIEYEETKKSIEEARKIFRAATAINKFARRKLAYLHVQRKREANRRLKVLGRFMIRCTEVLKKWRIVSLTKKWIRIQALFRGYSLRCHFYYWDGTYEVLWYELAKRRLARTIWTLWRNYKLHLIQTTVHVASTAPRLLSEWEKVLDISGYPLRMVGLFEEYLYPGTTKIFFYRNIETGTISFHKPKEIEKKDLQDYRSRQLYLEKGYTPGQLRLALKLQALWRGHKVRRMYIFITRATTMCLTAEKTFLTEPNSDRNLFNYTLYCHVVLNDYNRARPLYIEAMRRMQFKGPDVAQILYAYAIFVFVVHDEDINDCLHLIQRARQAEILHYNNIRKQKQRAEELSRGKEMSPYVDIPITPGKSFELAHVGFFRYLCNLRGSADSYHNYAACCFLVYDDFPRAFDAFMGAFKSDPLNTKLRENYNAMMTYFFGKNQNKMDEEVNRRMRYLADKDHQEKMERQQRVEFWNHRNFCATRIQKWYQHRRGMMKFHSILDKLRKKRKNLAWNQR